MDNLWSIIIFLLVGAAAGWIAGKLVNGSGKGFILNVIVGIVGSFLGGWLLPLVGVTWTTPFGRFCTAVIGAAILLIILSLFRKK